MSCDDAGGEIATRKKPERWAAGEVGVKGGGFGTSQRGVFGDGEWYARRVRCRGYG